MTQPTDDSDRIDDACDCFEQLWLAGTPVRIEDFVYPWNRGKASVERIELLKELVIIDMEYRWQAMGEVDRSRPNDPQPISSHTVPRSFPADRPMVEVYLERFRELGQHQGTCWELLRHEYRIRQTCGDRPDYRDYQKRFPHFPSSDERSLRELAIQLTQPNVKVFEAGTLILSTPMVRSLSIGRQWRHEPPPICLVSGSHEDRLVIAATSNRRVSRAHVHVDVAAKRRFHILNQSRKISVMVQSREELLPASDCYIEENVSLLIGRAIVRIESGHNDSA